MARHIDLQLAAAVRAVLAVQFEDALEQPSPTQPHRAPAVIDTLEPPGDLGEAVEDLFRSLILIADLTRPRRK